VVIAFYISGHGFGHASRSIELIRALLDRQPALRVIVRTSAPQWLFDVAGVRVDYRVFDADVGMTQRDSITMDVAETTRRAAAFYRSFARRADDEAAFLKSENVELVLGDIPPLAHAAAARAGLRSIAIGNFTWDWIYEGYETFERDAPGVIQTIRDAYALADRGLRLPLHGGFATFAQVVDIPLIARRAARGPDATAETRRILDIPGDRPFVLASFGGYGLDIPYDEIARRERLTVLAPAVALAPPLTYQDLVAAADVVLTKPGYGIISECVANGTPMLYTSRGRFVEYDVFVAEMPRILRCRFIPQEDLRAGAWRAHVDALLAQPAPPERARIDGAELAAELIMPTRPT
jgi:UDP:flavonoid glycosyltransferase YjiC (YdhE family)